VIARAARTELPTACSTPTADAKHSLSSTHALRYSHLLIDIFYILTCRWPWRLSDAILSSSLTQEHLLCAALLHARAKVCKHARTPLEQISDLARRQQPIKVARERRGVEELQAQVRQRLRVRAGTLSSSFMTEACTRKPAAWSLSTGDAPGRTQWGSRRKWAALPRRSLLCSSTSCTTADGDTWS
jgi:hypothetical protein